MKRCFKIVVSIALCAVLIFSLSSCFEKDSSGEEYYGDYHDGYVEGYADGTEAAKQQISGYVEECFNNVGLDHSIEEAIQILTNYADGEPISEHELQKAIWSVWNFYYDTCDIVFDIDNYVVD